MANNPASTITSETNALLKEHSTQQPTTITGKPLKYHHDNSVGIMNSESGGFTGGPPNLLPPAFTDDSLVRIPIRMSDIYGTEVQVPKKKNGFFRRRSSVADEIKVVMMSRGEYLKYWVKGEDGKFAGLVVEPVEGRQMWFEKQLQLNQKWVEEDPSLGKRLHDVSLLEIWRVLAATPCGQNEVPLDWLQVALSQTDLKRILRSESPVDEQRTERLRPSFVTA
ncbi:uncharacterized protein LTR77_003552 [Saxophila tyrrhenica]|uniref:Uncharacterized protein n=1 Tax=Saxophila tyrrhenica TaxID=1690608 RepID=A0AAV9PDZ5_9PEZI|nr:hypothetical protein LTR77_003552 [Saxophila tyrrhenica]